MKGLIGSDPHNKKIIRFVLHGITDYREFIYLYLIVGYQPYGYSVWFETFNVL